MFVFACYSGAWHMQVRRESVQTLAVLAACVMGLAAAEPEAGAAPDGPEHRLLHPSPALKVLVMRKPQAVEVRQLTILHSILQCLPERTSMH
jgi:hypothetical protein